MEEIAARANLNLVQLEDLIKRLGSIRGHENPTAIKVSKIVERLALKANFMPEDALKLKSQVELMELEASITPYEDAILSIQDYAKNMGWNDFGSIAEIIGSAFVNA